MKLWATALEIAGKIGFDTGCLARTAGVIVSHFHGVGDYGSRSLQRKMTGEEPRHTMATKFGKIDCHTGYCTSFLSSSHLLSTNSFHIVAQSSCRR
jgi:hypothetical protein